MAISYSFDELDDLLEKREIDSFELKMLFRNALAQIKDFDGFFTEMTDLFYWRFLSQPIFLTASVVMSLFLFLAVKHFYDIPLKNILNTVITLQDGWQMGAPYVMGMYTILFVLCKLGQEVQSTVSV